MGTNQSVLASWADDRTTVGSTMYSFSPTIAEALGHTPLDFLFLDRQHGSPVYERLVDIFRAADLTGTDTIVRVPKDDISMVTFCFDSGASAIMLPQIEDPEIVSTALEHVHYKRGRSLSTLSRAADYGYADRAEYIDHVNTEQTIIPQIETQRGIEQLEAITAIEGVTDIAIGPGDLAHDLNVEFGDPEHSEAIQTIYDIAEANNVGVGNFISSVEGYETYRSQSAFLSYGTDIGFLTSRYEDFFSTIEDIA